MRRIWPGPVAELDHDALTTLYTPADRATPSVRLNFVTSADGAVTLGGYSEGLSGPADKLVFGILRMLCDALLVGAGTLRGEGYDALRLSAPRRAWRRAHGLPDDPVLVVVSGRLALDPASLAFADAPVRPVVVTHGGSPVDRRRALSRTADVLVCGDTEVDFKAALAALADRGYAQVLGEGGPLVLGSLTAADLVDELCLTISPMLAGAGAGRITSGPPADPRPLVPAHVLEADGMLLVRYVRATSSPAG